MADSTLAAIRKKVRRLTRTPSEQQLSNADLDEFINTFIHFDFPPELRIESLKQNFTFYTAPNVDTYETSAVVTDPMYDFKDKYTAVTGPAYIAGTLSSVILSQEEFYNRYPLTNRLATETTGDGVSNIFTGTLSDYPVLQGTVVFSTVDTLGIARKAYDDGLGTFSGDAAGTIDYVTGDWALTWNDVPASAEPIYSATYAYQAAQPVSLLFFNNKFVVRPIPDKTYPITVQVYARPTALTAAGDMPGLEQWWQYIAFGTAIKIFYDRSEMDSVQELMPEFKNQEALVLRRTIIEQMNQRSSTIYSSGYRRIL